MRDIVIANYPYDPEPIPPLCSARGRILGAQFNFPPSSISGGYLLIAFDAKTMCA